MSDDGTALTARDSTALTARYRAVRSRTERLAAGLSAEDQTVQSMPDVSPTKWHRAHTTWFFETFVLATYQPGYRPFDPSYAFLFNSYYEAAGPRHARPQRGLISRPGVDEVTRYRAAVDDAMMLLLSDIPRADVDCAALADLVELGLHHEQQHQELLLMDIKHVLACNPFPPAFADGVAPPPPGRPDGVRWLEVEGGAVEIGDDGTGFAFDNERPRHTVWIEPFRLADRLVTVGEWREFVDDGGYRRPELWLSDGWAFVCANQLSGPLYWSGTGPDTRCFTLYGDAPARDDEPVCHVSHYEADAYARWAGSRLATEAEWEVAVATLATSGPADRSVDAGGVGQRFHPTACPPVDSTETRLRQVGTDVWEWTASAYLPYPRFQPAAGAVGEYNGKFMSNQMVLRGGSCLTPGGHSRPTYRNFFPPSARWPMTGVRLAADS